jgi:hypothetical protein
VKNYPNQTADFDRIRGTLATVRDLNDGGANVIDDGVLGYELARRRCYTFRGLTGPAATDDQIAARILAEQQKPDGSQGARTNAREMRRTLHNMGWLNGQAVLTNLGEDLLNSEPGSIAEQALLVAGLLEIQATDAHGSAHHPVATMLRLLAISPSLHRHGLELALEPADDSDAEFQRVAALYRLSPGARLTALGITDYQRANAVKIFPTLAVMAGLVVEEGGYYSLSQDGLRVIGKPPTQARNQIAKHRGRRTTIGKVVKSDDVAAHTGGKPSAALTPAEQRRAAEKLRGRTDSHQALVKRVAAIIGDDRGTLFEDQFAYDLVWLPSDTTLPAYLFEMKTVMSDTSAQARRAVGQLSYYEYFHVVPTITDGDVQRVAVFDASIPQELADYLAHEKIAVMTSEPGVELLGLNSLGVSLARLLLPS